jgi:hypothetical protein
VIELLSIMLAAVVREVLLPRRDFGGILLGFAVIPSAIWQKILLVEGTSLVVSELVISHNKFKGATCQL